MAENGTSATDPGLERANTNTSLSVASAASSSNDAPKHTTRSAPRPKRPALNQIYALPVPIKTFPLPSFYPSNPLSLFYLAYAWLRQTISPPCEPSIVHEGIWSAETRSVNIVDEKSIRALWEQGFYGKGNLSRSEPNWLRKEQVRLGLVEGHISEIATEERREERRQAKWERAKAELEAIRQTRLEEGRQTLALASEPPSGDNKGEVERRLIAPPVGPLELLALPNSQQDWHEAQVQISPGPVTNGKPRLNGVIDAIGDTKSSPLIGSNGLVVKPQGSEEHAPTTTTVNGTPANGIILSPPSTASSSDPGDDIKPLKRRKSVRFSPKVESTTYQLSDPPSPSRALSAARGSIPDPEPSVTPTRSPIQESEVASHNQPSHLAEVQNREHLQLAAEEAFFLSFALGVLKVVDPTCNRQLSTVEVFGLFRKYSYFPPRELPHSEPLRPDDAFLVNYVVYHHFRSLGWVPRGGIKFGVDWLLYTRGPVFDHAEFGLIIIPSYSDPWWATSGKPLPTKSWHWLHGINRVLSHVVKSLVFVYVDVPPPKKFENALATGVASVFETYKIREIMIKRWSSNRNRG
jgi:tRNA-splicing endonuclease subunit Sen2